MNAERQTDGNVAPSSEYRLRYALPTFAWSRDAGWHEVWYVVSYPFKTWRCRLFGHEWGPEQSDWEPNTGTKMQAWRDCQRPGCEGWWETYHYMAGGKQRVLG